MTCPVCSSDLPLKSEASGSPTLPKFCSECGCKFHHKCPECSSPFTHLARFCSECGSETYGNREAQKTIPAESASLVSQQNSKHLLARCRGLIPVSRRAIRESFFVIVRLNPAHVAAHTLAASIESITDTMSRPEIANLVGSALEEADLSDARGDLASSHDSIWQMANGIISASTKILKREFPAYPDYVSGHEWFVSPQEAGEAFANRIYRQVTMHAHELEIIEKHYSQLVEFFPRYYEIMHRSGFWGGVIGFAAGFFGGTIGAAGIETWNNWQEKSDQEFLDNYACAIDEFTSSAVSFTQKTEEAITPPVDQLADDLVACSNVLYDGLEKAMLAGHDISPACNALFYEEEPLDDEIREFVEIVIQNLKEEGLNANDESELRESMGMKRSP